MNGGAGLLAAAALLVASHVLTPWLRHLPGVPRSIWLSLFGGVSVAYVFVHLLPELARAQARLGRALEPGTEGAVPLERHVYLVALIGLAAFHGLEQMAARGRGRGPGAGLRPAVYAVHLGAFAAYNVIVGYLLEHRSSGGTRSLTAFTLAMALHFVVTGVGLQDHHGERYRRHGRWLLAAAVLLGVGLGQAIEVSEAALGLLVGFLAGGIVLNVLKEEVPEARRSRFWAFALGMGGYAGLLLAV